MVLKLYEMNKFKKEDNLFIKTLWRRYHFKNTKSQLNLIFQVHLWTAVFLTRLCFVKKVEVDGTNKYFIYNHLKFTIEYNQKNIVGFYVEPSAVGFFYKGSTVVSSCGNEIPNDDSVQSFE